MPLKYHLDDKVVESLIYQEPTQAGSQRTFEFKIESRYAGKIYLVPNITDPDLHLEQYPTSMNPGEIATVKVKYTPTWDREESLKTKIKFRVIVP